MVKFLRPCVRQNFPNFLFSRVSEKFGCRSSEIFRKKTEFLNLRNFREKIWKKVQKSKFGKNIRNYSKLYVNFKNFEKVCKVWVFESKKPVFGSKSLEIIRKSSEKVRKFRKLGFPNVRKFRKLLFSELSKIYEKMTLNSNFGNRKKLVPTRKPTRKFG